MFDSDDDSVFFYGDGSVVDDGFFQYEVFGFVVDHEHAVFLWHRYRRDAFCFGKIFSVCAKNVCPRCGFRKFISSNMAKTHKGKLEGYSPGHRISKKALKVVIT